MEHNNILTWACSVILPYIVRATSHILLPYNYKTQCLLIKENNRSVQVKCQFVFTLTCYWVLWRDDQMEVSVEESLQQMANTWGSRMKFLDVLVFFSLLLFASSTLSFFW